ncbi:hypothetical protein KXX11_007237, partial [Aspergillus fumigatus]
HMRRLKLLKRKHRLKRRNGCRPNKPQPITGPRTWGTQWDRTPGLVPSPPLR